MKASHLCMFLPLSINLQACCTLVHHYLTDHVTMSFPISLALSLSLSLSCCAVMR